MSQKSIPIVEIQKLAADIRVINDFAENHNFDTSLISATVEPTGQGNGAKDWSFIGAAVFAFLLFVLLAALNFSEVVSSATLRFCFVVGLLCAVLATLCMHKRFDNKTMTIIAGIGLLAILLIGTGVLTPREAVDEIRKIK